MNSSVCCEVHARVRTNVLTSAHGENLNHDLTPYLLEKNDVLPVFMVEFFFVEGDKLWVHYNLMVDVFIFVEVTQNKLHIIF